MKRNRSQNHNIWNYQWRNKYGMKPNTSENHHQSPPNYHNTFQTAGAILLKRKYEAENKISYATDREFRQLFGTSPVICGVIWVRCEFDIDEFLHKHLLWALMFLFVYATEGPLSLIAGTSQKNFRNKVWAVLHKMAAARPSIVSVSIYSVILYSLRFTLNLVF